MSFIPGTKALGEIVQPPSSTSSRFSTSATASVSSWASRPCSRSPNGLLPQPSPNHSRPPRKRPLARHWKGNPDWRRRFLSTLLVWRRDDLFLMQWIWKRSVVMMMLMTKDKRLLGQTLKWKLLINWRNWTVFQMCALFFIQQYQRQVWWGGLGSHELILDIWNSAFVTGQGRAHGQTYVYNDYCTFCGLKWHFRGLQETRCLSLFAEHAGVGACMCLVQCWTFLDCSHSALLQYAPSAMLSLDVLVSYDEARLEQQVLYRLSDMLGQHVFIWTLGPYAEFSVIVFSNIVQCTTGVEMLYLHFTIPLA